MDIGYNSCFRAKIMRTLHKLAILIHPATYERYFFSRNLGNFTHANFSVLMIPKYKKENDNE